jgi:hypothetical protein
MKLFFRICLFGSILLPCLLMAQTPADYKKALDKHRKDFEQANTVQEKEKHLKKMASFLEGQPIITISDYIREQLNITYKQITSNKRLASLLPLSTFMMGKAHSLEAKGIDFFYQALEFAKQYDNKEIIFETTYYIVNELFMQSKPQEALFYYHAMEQYMDSPEMQKHIESLPHGFLPNLYCVIAQIYLVVPYELCLPNNILFLA